MKELEQKVCKLPKENPINSLSPKYNCSHLVATGPGLSTLTSYTLSPKCDFYETMWTRMKACQALANTYKSHSNPKHWMGRKHEEPIMLSKTLKQHRGPPELQQGVEGIALYTYNMKIWRSWLLLVTNRNRLFRTAVFENVSKCLGLEILSGPTSVDTMELKRNMLAVPPETLRTGTLNSKPC